ncbi:hypothetical protein EXU48_09035 [Occultella glacieicola]|uniref:Uncharacterized protein n=1 Tax=Occultella glacieicola TaxID=2518684 RepID=A0ABY2E6M1_9MICO|nr:hypothetical protein [Occultella glacieicola]TDE94918.1 hypothetical protein EXU48_09035 [Occultella glacieicola]
MRLKALLLIWPGLALLWLGVAVLPWGRESVDDVSTLVDVGDLLTRLPDVLGSSFPEPLAYLQYGFLFPLVLTSLFAVGLPARARPVRVLVGIAYVAAAALALASAMELWSGLDRYLAVGPPWTRTGLLVLAAAMLVTALAMFADQVWPVAGLVGLVALAGAVWTAHVVITLWRDGGGVEGVDLGTGVGLPGPGSVAVVVGYLLASAGAFMVFTRRQRRRRR